MGIQSTFHAPHGGADFLGIRRSRNGATEIVYDDGVARRMVWRVASGSASEARISDALRVAVLLAFDALSYEACALVYDTLGWPHPAGRGGFGGDFGGRIAQSGMAELCELLVLLTVAEPLSDERLSPESLAATFGACRVLGAYGVDHQRWWPMAQAAASAQIAAEAAQAAQQAQPAAGAARREMTPTEAFVAQHAPARKGARPAVKYRNAQTGET